MSSGTSTDLWAVWGSSTNDVFAVGKSGAILHYNGTAWSPMNSGISKDLWGVWGLSPSDVFAVGDGGTILHYNGKAWSPMVSGTTEYLWGVWGSSPQQVFAVGYWGTILRYDGTKWWQAGGLTLSRLFGVWGSSSSDVWAVGEAGALLHYDGKAWGVFPSWGPIWLWGIWGSSGSDVYAVGESGRIRHYDGSTWDWMNSGGTKNLYDVWGSPYPGAFAVGQGGTIVQYSDGKWSQMSSGTSRDLYGVWGTSTEFFAVGASGTILHYFVPPPPPPPPDPISVEPGHGCRCASIDVTIRGGNFIGATGVSFGPGVTVNSFSVQSPVSISASIAIDCWTAFGPRTVLVTTPTGTGALEGGFTVQPAIPTSVEPDQGGKGEMLEVVINGLCLTGAMGVSFGPGVTVDDFTVEGPDRITATITIGCSTTAGPRDVMVATEGGVGVLEDGFTVEEAPITIVEPDEACACESLDVTIVGTCFAGAQAVSFGPGIAVNGFVVHGPSEIVASITIDCTAEPGPRDVVVTTSTGAVSQPGTFIVTGVNVASVEPDRVCRCDTAVVVINGGCFAGAADVSFGPGITVNGFSVDDPGQITALITVDCAADFGTREVSVTTPAGTDILAGGFMVEPTTVDSVEPAEGRQGETLSVAISGTCFEGATDVSFGPGTTVNSFTVDSARRITAVVAIDFMADLGARDVSVTTPVGSAVQPHLFNVVPIPLSATWSLTGYGSGTMDPETGDPISGSITVVGEFTGDLGGSFSGTATWIPDKGLWQWVEEWGPATLTVISLPHPAQQFGEGLVISFGEPADTPCSVLLAYVTGKEGAFTTDGSQIYGHGDVSGSGAGILCLDREASTWTLVELSCSGLWTGAASGLLLEPEIAHVGPGTGTVVLTGLGGTVADLRYSTTGTGRFGLAQYGGNPGGDPPRLPLGTYVEADSDILSPWIAWPIEFRVYYTDAEVIAAGIRETTLRMYRWDGSVWSKVADSGVNTSEKYVWAMLTGFSPYAPMGDPLCPDWDVNCDGCTDVLDIVLVGQHFGETGGPHWIREDVNRDGVISVLDIVVIGQHFGEWCTP